MRRDSRARPEGSRKRPEKGRPESIETILDRFLERHRVRKRLDGEDIWQRWSQVVGEEIARHTRVVDLRAGVLHVEVNSPPLLHELSTYFAGELLASLRESGEFSGVHEFRFRHGSF